VCPSIPESSVALSNEPVPEYLQKVTKLFGLMMSELQINYLASLEARVSAMEETLDSYSESMSEETI